MNAWSLIFLSMLAATCAHHKIHCVKGCFNGTSCLLIVFFHAPSKLAPKLSILKGDFVVFVRGMLVSVECWKLMHPPLASGFFLFLLSCKQCTTFSPFPHHSVTTEIYSFFHSWGNLRFGTFFGGPSFAEDAIFRLSSTWSWHVCTIQEVAVVVRWPEELKLTNWRPFFMRLSCYWSWISSSHCQSSCGSTRR